ncbi:uncharacterized protein LOC130671095 [Microplitis mediator]|uniref:uncharacterized protein LOC130671095 n=1 Tax=Microplitis mediator TaxID=375433 RepID=UPI0025571B9B|nr:uncharacterized protein LOC130671095 [Microplitis mediator]
MSKLSDRNSENGVVNQLSFILCCITKIKNLDLQNVLMNNDSKLSLYEFANTSCDFDIHKDKKHRDFFERICTEEKIQVDKEFFEVCGLNEANKHYNKKKDLYKLLYKHNMSDIPSDFKHDPKEDINFISSIELETIFFPRLLKEHLFAKYLFYHDLFSKYSDYESMFELKQECDNLQDTVNQHSDDIEELQKRLYSLGETLSRSSLKIFAEDRELCLGLYRVENNNNKKYWRLQLRQKRNFMSPQEIQSELELQKVTLVKSDWNISHIPYNIKQHLVDKLKSEEWKTWYNSLYKPAITNDTVENLEKKIVDEIENLILEIRNLGNLTEPYKFS